MADRRQLGGTPADCVLLGDAGGPVLLTARLAVHAGGIEWVPHALSGQSAVAAVSTEEERQEELEHANVVEDLHRVVEDGGNIEEEGGYGMDNA